jgi:hypothetical protein
MSNNGLSKIKGMDANSGSLYAKYNTVRMVNPYKCHFIAAYPGGKKVKGKNLYDTGWKELGDGISSLHYKLSTGQIINIPKFQAYMHLVEVSESMDGSRLFHSVNIKGLADNKTINYKIILKQDNISKHKIGDIIISEDNKPTQSPHWKASAV